MGFESLAGRAEVIMGAQAAPGNELGAACCPAYTLYIISLRALLFLEGGGLWFTPCHTAQKKGQNYGLKRINFF